ncbi:MAG: hypothetical protein V3S01_02835 [Dehalococcoidia bacterium]
MHRYLPNPETAPIELEPECACTHGHGPCETHHPDLVVAERRKDTTVVRIVNPHDDIPF